MSTTNLNIRTDKDVKEKAEKIFNELGLNMTSAVNIFLRTAIRERGIPFETKQRLQRLKRGGEWLQIHLPQDIPTLMN